MLSSPYIFKAMMESEPRDQVPQARQAQLIHEAEQAKRLATARLPAALPGTTEPLAGRHWRWQVRLLALLRAN